MQNENKNIVDMRSGKNTSVCEVKTEENKTAIKEGKHKFELSWWNKLKSIKHIEIILGAIVIIVMVVAYSYSVRDKSAIKDTTSQGTSLSVELQNILSEIKGVGNVKVLIAYNGGKKLEIASKVDKHSNIVSDDGRITETITEESSPIIVDGDKPLVIGEKRADIDGVIVVAEGGGNNDIRAAITRAMTTLLKINYSDVQVFEMK